MHTLRQEFISLAQQEGANKRALCERFGISPKTGYKWLARHAQQGVTGLLDRSRRPSHTPLRASVAIEQVVVALREEHPSWGGRKLHRRLLDLGHADVPTPSTITRILHRHSLITPQASERSTAWQRFEHREPNDLWQIDFKGYFQTGKATCHPLTVLDDHSRYNLVLQAMSRPDGAHVQERLIGAFRQYGLPVRINADNGPPWGSSSQHEHGITQLTVWLIRLGIRVSHSRPGHPQTNGKEERFHRSFKAEVLAGRHFYDLQEAQCAFDQWRAVYNHERPHEAIAMATPVTRYRPSRLPYPEQLPDIVYPDSDTIIPVGWNGDIAFHQRHFKVSSALHNYRIAARAVASEDGVFDLFFVHQRIGKIDLRKAPKQT